MRKKIPSRKALAEELVIEAHKRIFGQGLVKYGDFCPKTDTRVLTVEAQQEALDIWAYIAEFFYKKYPHLRKKTENVRALTLSLYIALRELEEVERAEMKRTRK